MSITAFDALSYSVPIKADRMDIAASCCNAAKPSAPASQHTSNKRTCQLRPGVYARHEPRCLVHMRDEVVRADAGHERPLERRDGRGGDLEDLARDDVEGHRQQYLAGVDGESRVAFSSLRVLTASRGSASARQLTGSAATDAMTVLQALMPLAALLRSSSTNG